MKGAERPDRVRCKKRFCGGQYAIAHLYEGPERPIRGDAAQYLWHAVFAKGPFGDATAERAPYLDGQDDRCDAFIATEKPQDLTAARFNYLPFWEGVRVKVSPRHG